MPHRDSFIKKVFLIIILLPLLTISADKLGWLEGPSVSGEANDLKVGDVNVIPLQVSGPAEERLNLIIFGDGYTADEMDKFHEDVDRNQNIQWSQEPFRSYRNYFNVYIVETPSVDSGVSYDRGDGNVKRDTALNMEFAQDIERLLTFGPGGQQIINTILEEQVGPELGIPADSQNLQILAMANTTTYGGAGGSYATTTGGSPQGPLVSLHELGHSLGNLQDEYAYYNRGVPGEAHSDNEPSSIHHTRMTSEEMIENKAKWWRWLGEESESGGVIKAADPDGYESGLYSKSNVWRPSNHSMMRHTGFYFDQVSREQITQRITGMRETGQMPLSSTPEGEVGTKEILWVETMYPRFHVLDVKWEVNGKKISGTDNARYLDLGKLNVESDDVIKVTVRDQTEFVRDPDFLKSPRMSQNREWIVGEQNQETEVDVKFTNHSPLEHNLAYDEVVFVHTTNPTDRMLDVTWKLNGEKMTSSHNSRFIELDKFDLPEGASTLSATVTDLENEDNGSETISWTIDNKLPKAHKELSESLVTLYEKDEHHVYFNEFDMIIDPQDDQDGFVVGELRLNDDGWYSYAGFPKEMVGDPFNFSHSGIDEAELTYGNLGAGGIAKATFEQSYTEDDPGGKFIPGFGTHKIEHRAIDAAGNIGDASEFTATVLPGELLACTQTQTNDITGDLVISEEGVTCLENITIDGDIIINKNSSLMISNSEVNGDIQSSYANAIQIFDSEINGQVEISNTSEDITLVGNEIKGWFMLIHNQQVSANEQYGDYGPVVVGNSIDGMLATYNNNDKLEDFGVPNEVSGLEIGDDSDYETTTKSIELLVEEFTKTNEFSGEDTIYALRLHLTAINHFEDREIADKVVKHTKGLKLLLEHQKASGDMSERAFKILNAEADRVINKWS